MACRLSDWRPPEIRLRRRRFYGYVEEFLEWSRHMAYYFRQRDYDEVEQCDIAINCLAGYAWDWWCRVEDKRWERALQPVETWEQLVYLMTRHFAPQVDPVAYAAHSYRRTLPARSPARATTSTRAPANSTRSPASAPASARIPDLARVPERVPARAPDPVLIAAPTVPEFIAAPNEPEFIAAPTKPVFIAAPSEPEIIAAPTELELIVKQAITTAPSESTIDAPPTEQKFIAAPTEPTFNAMIVVQVPTGSSPLLSTDAPDDAPSPGPEYYSITFEVPRVGPVPDVVFILPIECLLSLAPPSSKRGRFESKGGRMMRPSPHPNRVQARPMHPRPWRPPWFKTRKNARNEKLRESQSMKIALFNARLHPSPKIAFYKRVVAIIIERVPRVLQVSTLATLNTRVLSNERVLFEPIMIYNIQCDLFKLDCDLFVINVILNAFMFRFRSSPI